MVMDGVDPQQALLALTEAKKSHGGWYRANCPYCIDRTGKMDKRQSLGIKPAIEFFSCFKCGARGRLPETQDELWAPPKDDTNPEADVLAEDLKECRDHFEPLWEDDAWTSVFLEEPVNYLKGRGISQEIVRGARIGACLDGKFAGRIVVPIHDIDQRTWLGFSARDWTNKQFLRYRYPRGMERAKFLYNQAALYRESDQPALVVEGVFDALPYWPDAVACLGKPGDVHFALLTEAERPLAICLDGDAWEEAWSLSEKLRLYGRPAGYVQLPPCADPNTVEPGWLREEAIKCLST